MRITADDLERLTPASRDRYVDFVRAFSIVVVVIGHWAIALIFWEDASIYVHNVVGHQSGLWLATWVLQVMPLFFFVGGFSNSMGWHSATTHGSSYRGFMAKRLSRLLKPTAVFVGVWLIVEVGLHVLNVGADGMFRGTFLPFGPLWFLGVYVVVIALTPVTLYLHQRWRITALVAFTAVVVTVEVLRFGFGVGWIGWLNLLIVWVLIHQIGYFYADGSLINAGPRTWWTMVAVGLTGLIVLTNADLVTGELWYPRSMVGVDIEPVSNMSPPSLAIVSLACWQIGAAMLLRKPITRWLHKPIIWSGVVYINSIIMTIFLWHLTAFVIAILILYPLGFGQPTEPSATWWTERIIWIAAPTIVLSLLVAIFGRFEQTTTAAPTKA
ncbi:MAG: acyltransferase family protein [Acidimicrobiia bacterium]